MTTTAIKHPAKFSDALLPVLARALEGRRRVLDPVGGVGKLELIAEGFNIFNTMNEKGAEYKYYKVFNPHAKEDTVADWESVLGEPCSVMVGHRQGRGEYADSVFDEIKSLSPIPHKYKAGVAEASLVPCIGDCEDPDNDATKSLYGLVKWIHGRRIVE
jgi:hypothetical protein